ncbi:hypothetical protein [Rhodopirellula baltica]|nr:hypothetical protein [Rhodopirellula baltica]
MADSSTLHRSEHIDGNVRVSIVLMNNQAERGGDRSVPRWEPKLDRRAS